MSTYKTAKKGKLTAILAEEILWYEICVDPIGPYKIIRKGEETLILKAVNIIDPLTGWFEITQYKDKKSMKIANLVETTRLVCCPWPVEITYY